MLKYHSNSVRNENQITTEFKSFSNPEVIVMTYDDKRLACIRESPCRYEQQDEYGPTFVVIRPGATDEQLDKISNRFHLPINELIAFRTHTAR